MSKNSGYPTTSGVNNKVGPDFFGLYTSEVEELVSRDEGLLPSSHLISHLSGNLHDEVGRGKGSNKNTKTKENDGMNGSTLLFSNGVGAVLLEPKKERLKSVLRQSVFTLTKEVDEMIDPVLSICRIRSSLTCKEHLLSSDASACKDDQPQQPNKRLKHECSLKNGQIMNSGTKDGKECAEIDDDLRFLLESDTTKVEELVKNHSSEFFTTLHHMEQKLEELLNNLMTSCRPMTLAEKQLLRKWIQNLSPRNLDRVVEIIGSNKLPSDKYSCDEVHVDLDGMDNVTLWRLYFYVMTIQASTI